jgi:hypothetical protein
MVAEEEEQMRRRAESGDLRDVGRGIPTRTPSSMLLLLSVHIRAASIINPVIRTSQLEQPLTG